MIRFRMMPLAAALAVAVVPAGAAFAQMEPPMVTPAMATSTAPYLQLAGEGDLFEIESSNIALQKSQRPDVRKFATMMIDHHTRTTNNLLAAAKADNISPPPAVLSAPKRALLDQLNAAPAGSFDSLYLGQQQTAHEEALTVHSTYANSGDRPALKKAATGTVPVVSSHLEQVKKLRAAR